MEIKGEGEVTQIGLIFLGLNLSKFWFNWSKLGLNFGLIGLNFPLDWSKISSTVLKRKKETSTAFEQ